LGLARRFGRRPGRAWAGWFGRAAKGWRDEVAIEPLLLVRREQSPNFDVGVNQRLAPLTLEVAALLLNPVARVLHHLTDLGFLGGGEVEHAIHPLERPLARDMKDVMTEGERTAGETECDSRDECERD